jgi:hemerythrin
MPFMEWNESFSVKVPAIDEQHRQLLVMINSLHEAMLAGGAPAKVRPVFNELVSYTRYHFSSEEKMLEAAAYPALEDHKTAHKSLVAQVGNFSDQIADGKSSTALKLMAFLKDWLTNHILQTDMRYSSHLVARRAA